MKALVALNDENEAQRFMADLCTPQEIEAFAERWAIARELNVGEMSYREISANLKASTTTVSRVARFLNKERHQGYRLILDRLFGQRHPVA